MSTAGAHPVRSTVLLLPFFKCDECGQIRPGDKFIKKFDNIPSTYELREFRAKNHRMPLNWSSHGDTHKCSLCKDKP